MDQKQIIDTQDSEKDALNKDVIIPDAVALEMAKEIMETYKDAFEELKYK